MEVSGLIYVRNAVDSSCAKDVLEYISSKPWEANSGSVYERRRQQYGYRCDNGYGKDNDYVEIGTIPEELKGLRSLALAHTNGRVTSDIFERCSFNQCTVDKYEPGQHLSSSIGGSTLGPVIACFTLCAGGTVAFSNDISNICVFKYMEANSLHLITGKSRYDWKHRIDAKEPLEIPRSYVRMTVTFRSIEQ